MLGDISIMNYKELKRTYDIFTDTWKFFKKYAIIEDKNNDEFWKTAINECNAISKQYGQCRLAVDLLTASIADLERDFKENQENIETQQGA